MIELFYDCRLMLSMRLNSCTLIVTRLNFSRQQLGVGSSLHLTPSSENFTNSKHFTLLKFPYFINKIYARGIFSMVSRNFSLDIQNLSFNTLFISHVILVVLGNSFGTWIRCYMKNVRFGIKLKRCSWNLRTWVDEKTLLSFRKPNFVATLHFIRTWKVNLFISIWFLAYCDSINAINN